ncbi:MAG: sialate O-acetylesterase [Lachnospiraceae bacterium]|nr:sialate O-acetylesterase [Lachnospiraceae bacterium]
MIQLPSIFSNHMVMQRNKNIAVWGESDGSEVAVTLDETTVTVPVQNGSFEVLLPPRPAGGPYVMKVSSEETELCFEDVMIGEVWLAGGQSNMELELQNSKNGAEVVKNIHNDKVRYYYTPKVSWVGDELYEAERISGWDLCTSDKAARWSAVAYYFAEQLSGELGVTVGIIGCNWGGTSASCWVSRETLEGIQEIRKYITDYDDIVAGQDLQEYIKEWEDYLVYQAEFDKNVGHYYETAENPSWDEALELYGENKYPGPMGPRSFTRPCGLYESMLQRVCPYTLAGFLYYQGEEDDHRPYSYYTLLSALIRRWRGDWKDDSLPFMLVQLPMFRNGEDEPDYQNWSFVREAQMRVYQTVKNTGIAVILDKGEFGNIHPTEKDIVGQRLALQALHHVYGKCSEEEAFGPVYQSYRIEGDDMIFSFRNAQGMHCTEDILEGFELAGRDKVYHTANAVLQGEEIVVTCDAVEEPVYGRFCWTNYRPVTLFGANGIPVAPFRTSREDGAFATGSRNGWEY